MKKSIASIIVFTLVLVFSNQVTAQSFSNLDKSPMDAASYPSSYRVSDKKVKITYSRPQLKGRKVSKLAPNGKVWRTGANEASEITFYQDVTFGGNQVKAGTYTLFTIPGESEWTVILSNAKNVWGSYFYKESEDVVRVAAAISNTDKPTEAFSIAFEGEDDTFNMYLGWGNIIATIPVKG